MSVRAIDLNLDDEGEQQPFNKRYAVDIIGGIEIYQFTSEVDMEYHANHEALPSRDEQFLGFDVKNQPSTALKEFNSKFKDARLASYSCNAVSNPSCVGLLSSSRTHGDAEGIGSDDLSRQQPVNERYGGDDEGKGQPSNKLYDIDIIDGIAIYQFSSEVDMEFHANHEALTSRGEKFRGFDVKTQPSRVFLDSFYLKVEESPVNDCVSPEKDEPVSTALSAKDNTVEDEDCFIVYCENLVPIQQSLCSHCGKLKKINKNKSLPYPTEIINLDSDEDQPALITQPNGCSGSDMNNGSNNYQPEVPNIISVRAIQDDPSSEKSCSITTESNSFASEPVNSQLQGYLLPDEPVGMEFPSKFRRYRNLISPSTMSAGVDDIICLDSDEDTSHVSPKEVSNTNTHRHFLLSQGNRKDSGSQSKTMCNSNSRSSPVVNAHKSQKTVSQHHKEMIDSDDTNHISHDNVSNIETHQHSAFDHEKKDADFLVSQQTDNVLSDASVHVEELHSEIRSHVVTASSLATPTVDDEIVCLDSDDDTSHVSHAKVSNTETHRHFTYDHEKKAVDLLSRTMCNSVATPSTVCEAPLLRKIVIHTDRKVVIDSVVSQQTGNVLSDESLHVEELYSKIRSDVVSALSLSVDDEIVCLDSDDDTSPLSHAKVINNETHQHSTFDHKKKNVNFLSPTICNSAPISQKTVNQSHGKVIKDCAVSQQTGNVLSDASVHVEELYSKIRSHVVTASSLATSTVDDEIVCLDSDDDTSHASYDNVSNIKTLLHSTFGHKRKNDDVTSQVCPVKVSKTETHQDFVLNQGEEKNIDSQSKTVFNLGIIRSPVLEFPVSQTMKQRPHKEIVGVVQDLVDFVCRQEEIANIQVILEQYDESYPTTSHHFQTTSPCLKQYCTMGCICYCIRRKFKRKRCGNHECIFDCICFSALKPRRDPSTNGKTESQRSDMKDEVTFSTSTEIVSFKRQKYSYDYNSNKNESVGVQSDLKQNDCVVPSKQSRRKQILPSVREIDPLDYVIMKPNPTKCSVATQPVKSTSAFQKIGQVVQQSLWELEERRKNSLFKKIKFISESLDQHREYSNNTVLKHQITGRKDQPKVPVQTCQHTHVLASADDPPPAFAMTCLTPGIGYVALEEFGSSILRVCEPFDPSTCRTFTSVGMATNWINSVLREHLDFDEGVELKWLVANSVMIDRKKTKRFDRNVLLDPRCRITKNGVVFM